MDVRTAVSRRSLTRSVLWGVPAVSLAAAAPAFAASGDVDLSVSILPWDGTQELGGYPELYWSTEFAFRIVVTNAGPSTLPAGSELTFSLAVSPVGGYIVTLEEALHDYGVSDASIGMAQQSAGGGTWLYTLPILAKDEHVALTLYAQVAAPDANEAWDGLEWVDLQLTATIAAAERDGDEEFRDIRSDNDMAVTPEGLSINWSSQTTGEW